MKPFHHNNQDPLYAAAAAILAGQTVTEEAALEEAALEEGVEDIAMAVANFKKGDKTNFGVVTDVGEHSISFKAKDLPVTKIAFNQRKMGSKDFVLDKLVKLKEGVELEEAVNWDFIQSMYVKDAIDVLVPLVLAAGAATYRVAKNAIKDYISDKKKNKAAEEDAAVLKKAIDKISKDSAASQLADQIKEIPYKKRGDNSQRLALVKKYRVRLKSLLTPDEYSQLNDIYNETIREGVELEEAVKANDPANLRSIIANHTALLNKATDSKAKEFHRVAIANAKEKLKSLGESELDEAYKVGFPLAKKAIKAATDLDPDEFKQFLGGMADYFYDVAAMDDGDPVMSRSYIAKTAVHFEQAYKGWKPE